MSRLFMQNLKFILSVVMFLNLALDSFSAQAQENPEAVVEVVEDDAEDLDEDEDDAPAAVNMFGNWGTTKEKVYGAKKFLLEQDFAVEVEQAIEVCELDERQLKRLKIASKGAIKKAFEKFKTTGLQQFGMAMGNPGNEDDEDQDKEDEVTPEVFTDADDIDMQTMQLVGGMMNPFQSELPTESKFWKKALKASLGDDQHQKLMKHRAERDLLKRKKNVESAVEALAFELRLSDETKQTLSDIVTPKMLKADTKNNIGPMYEQIILYYYASKSSKSKLKKILSKAQLQKWKSVMAPAKQVGQMIEMQNGQNDDEDAGLGGTWEEAEALIEAAGDIVEGAADLVEEVLGK